MEANNLLDVEDLFIKNKHLCIAMENLLDKRLKKYDLTSSQGYLLLYICKNREEDLHITNLHKGFRISQATLSGNVKRLRQKSFVIFECCKEDERRKKLIPTQKAIDVSEMVEEEIMNTKQSVYGILDKKERQELLRIEDKIIQHIIEQEEQND